ncbi:MAG: hypothetical protein ACRD5G_11110 [Candidatus Acidiferrales bacterium]
MTLKCLFRYDDGSYCKRWAQKESRFCYNHQPQGLEGRFGSDWPTLHPFTRLATLSDLFEFTRETLNALRMGTMPPTQGATIIAACNFWLKLYEKMQVGDRLDALRNQVLPTLVDAESAIHAERLEASTETTESVRQLESEIQQIVAHGPDALHRESGPAITEAAPSSPDAQSAAAPHAVVLEAKSK